MPIQEPEHTLYVHFFSFKVPGVCTALVFMEMRKSVCVCVCVCLAAGIEAGAASQLIPKLISEIEINPAGAESVHMCVFASCVCLGACVKQWISRC